MVTLGVFILWFGWFGFNGGSQLALGTAADVVKMSLVLVNTNLAAAAGVVSALVLSRLILGRIDLFAVLNGAIAGLVSITAGPAIVEHYWAIIIGAVGGLLCTAGIKLLEKLKVDDVVGAIPAHLFAGTWGTLAVCIAGGGDILAQAGRRGGRRRVRFRRVVAAVEGYGPDAGIEGFQRRGTVGAGHRGAGN